MLFNVERDLGDEIIFYLVPDAFSAIPSARLISRDDVILELEANDTRQALVAAGRHATGRCAFAINASMVPDLAERDDLTIVDADTELLIYRRPRPWFVNRRVLNLWPGLFPPRALNAALQEHFQYAVPQLERYGHETVNQFFLRHDMPSVMLSGRINHKNYEHYIDNVFEVFFFLDEPYMAMAERLIILAKIQTFPTPEALLGERDAMLFQPAMEFASSLDMTDGRALRRAFRAMPDEAAVALVNPQVRLLTSSTPTEMARDNAIPKALDVLAGCAAFGIARTPELYCDTIAAHLGFESSLIWMQPRFQGVEQLAQLLKSEARIDHLIEQDLALYSIAESAFAKTT